MSLCVWGPLAAVLSSRESPAEPSSLGPCESRHRAPGVRVPVQTVFAAGVQISTLASRFKGSKLCGRPFMWTRIISGTYVHNLQRTTPTAFNRFSCVRCAFCLLAGSSSSWGRRTPTVSSLRRQRALLTRVHVRGLLLRESGAAFKCRS